MKKKLTREQSQIKKLKQENDALTGVIGKMLTQFDHIRQNEQTARCPICGVPYVFYPNVQGDQSACVDCKAFARGARKKRVMG